MKFITTMIALSMFGVSLTAHAAETVCLMPLPALVRGIGDIWSVTDVDSTHAIIRQTKARYWYSVPQEFSPTIVDEIVGEKQTLGEQTVIVGASNVTGKSVKMHIHGVLGRFGSGYQMSLSDGRELSFVDLNTQECAIK